MPSLDSEHVRLAASREQACEASLYAHVEQRHMPSGLRAQSSCGAGDGMAAAIPASVPETAELQNGDSVPTSAFVQDAQPEQHAALQPGHPQAARERLAGASQDACS